jgi:ATP-binding protein involved in chromosome partitioning
VQLSLIQSAPVTGAVIVTTPSTVSLDDARKAVHMFYQVKVPILGLVENMSYFVEPSTGKHIDVFGTGGGKKTAEEMEIPFLGEIPLDPAVRMGGDTGRPIALRTDLFRELAGKITSAVAALDRQAGPVISITE